MAEERNYQLQAAAASGTTACPEVDYRPRQVSGRLHPIGLIGCGGIARTHLQAYRAAGFVVTVLCDRVIEKAQLYRDEYYPQAVVTDDYRDVLADANVQIVDLTPYPADRVPLIEAALRARKHVLSQKPFVLDLEHGAKLVQLAEQQQRLLAVNQNGRWAPHFAYARELVRSGYLGQVKSVRQSVRWDHNWIRDLPFNDVHHILLYDFGIHWFDFICSIFAGQTARRVFASSVRTATQLARPPLLSHVAMDFPHAQATITFDADTKYAANDRTMIAGSQGVLVSEGLDLNHQSLTVETEAGVCRPELSGMWFPDGFHGSMAELMWAIEQNCQPLHNARDNLLSLGLCYAAMRSADSGEVVEM